LIGINVPQKVTGPIFGAWCRIAKTASDLSRRAVVGVGSAAYDVMCEVC